MILLLHLSVLLHVCMLRRLHDVFAGAVGNDLRLLRLHMVRHGHRLLMLNRNMSGKYVRGGSQRTRRNRRGQLCSPLVDFRPRIPSCRLPMLMSLLLSCSRHRVERCYPPSFTSSSHVRVSVRHGVEGGLRLRVLMMS